METGRLGPCNIVSPDFQTTSRPFFRGGDAMNGQDTRPPRGTVEELLRRIEALAPPAEANPPKGFELWVPQRLTLRGQTIPFDVALMVVLDALLEKSFVPAGFTEEDGGRLYLYEHAGASQPQTLT
jgi:hypothetical protein